MAWNTTASASAAAGSLLVAFGWNVAATWPGMRGLRRAVGAHWSEQARVVFPHLGTASIVAIYAPVTLGLAAHALDAGTFGVVSVILMASAGAILGSFPISRAIDPASSWSRWPVAFQFWRHQVVVLWALGMAMPSKLNVVACGMALLWLAWVAATNLAPLRMGFGRSNILPAPPGLVARARRIAEASNAPFRGIHLSRTAGHNALALPVSSEVVVAESLVRELDEAELDAILRHEMDHLREPAWMTLGRIVSANAHGVLLLAKPVMGTFGHAGIGALMLAWLLPSMGLGRLARKFESKADAHGAGADPMAFASALLKMHRKALVPAVLERPGTHPHLYDRLIACGFTPDFPRPKPANVMSLPGALTAAAGGIMVAVSLGRWFGVGGL
jgi:Zn-dependent protease with chaperone function